MKRGMIGTLLGAVLAVSLASLGAMAQTIELKVSHYLPPNHQMHKQLEAWSAELAQRSNGRLRLAIFPAAQMGPMPRQYDLARTGVADIAFFLHGALPGRFPLTEISHLPYAFNRGEGASAKALSTAEASGILTELSGKLAAEIGKRVLDQHDDQRLVLDQENPPSREIGQCVDHNRSCRASRFNANRRFLAMERRWCIGGRHR